MRNSLRQLVALVTAGCGAFVGCGFQPTNVGADAIRDSPVDAFTIPRSCNELHTASPTQPSSLYQIDPDGPGGDPSISVHCDMDAEGGGWTIIFVASANLETTPVEYTTSTPTLLAAAQSVLLGYRNAADVVATGHATFALPHDWQTNTPFNYQSTDLITDVSIDGAEMVTTTLRYGYASYLTMCDDPWATSGVAYGRLCVVGTRAPFYSGFATPAADTCSDSQSAWDAASCTGERQLSIAVR